jgi:lantibiotic modifying enzyme
LKPVTDMSNVTYVTEWMNKWTKLNYTNSSKEKIYCDESGNIFSSLNNSLEESLQPIPINILITLFCILKITGLCGEFPQNIMP